MKRFILYQPYGYCLGLMRDFVLFLFFLGIEPTDKQQKGEILLSYILIYSGLFVISYHASHDTHGTQKERKIRSPLIFVWKISLKVQ